MRKWIFAISLVVFSSSIYVVQSISWAQDDAQEDDTIDLEDELDQEYSVDEVVEGVKEDPETAEELQDPQLVEPEKPKEEVVEEEPEEEPAPQKAMPSREAIALEDTDSPNIELEDRLFKIFSELKGPIVDSEWRDIVMSRKSEVYTVQKGDTLWDISRSFFGDPFFWPKIWSLNKDIYNPHFVVPKQKLVFFPGTVTQEPTIEIEEPVEKVSNEVAKKLTKEDREILPEFEEEEDLLPSEGLRAATIEDVIIPPSRTKSTARLPVIPPSLPIWDVGTQKNEGTNIIFSGKPLSQPTEVVVPLASFVAEEFPESDGRLVKVNAAQMVGSNFHPVYVEVFGGKVGEKLLIISQVKKPKTFYNKVNGVPISVDGEVKIVEEIDKDADLFRGLITANINPIVVGAKLIRQTFPKVELSLKGTLQNIEGKVTGGFLDGKTEILGPGYFVYLNIGTKDGVKVGGILSVLANELARDAKTLDEINSREIGIIKVVHVQDTISTGVIVAASEEILPGDYVGAPGPLLKEQLALTRTSGFQRDLLQELSDEDLIREASPQVSSKSKDKDDDDVELDEDDEESDEDFLEEEEE